MNTTSPQASAELVVLLDEEGHHVGTAPKAHVHQHDTPLHLAFSCYIFDPSGRLLVTRRALGKRTWPGVWSNSCCGHPGPGESPEDAVRRRVHEELGLALHDLRVRLPDFRYRAVDATGTVENEMCPVYTATTTDEADPDADEIVDWRWVPWDRFTTLARDAPWAISPWAAEQAPLLARRLAGDEGR